MASDLVELHRARTALLEEAVAADQRVQELQNVLAKEQGDVAQLREGVLGFLQSLAMTDEMKNEQREATDAAARLREGVAQRDELYRQIAQLDARIAAYDPVQLAREAAAKKATAEVEELARVQSVDEQILALGARIEAIDYELSPLTAALQAGHAAMSSLADAVHSIAEARRDGIEQKRTERKLLEDALAKAKLFYAALDELPAPDDVTPRIADSIGFEDREPYEGDLAPRLTRLQELLDYVRTRHAEVSQRRLAFEHQRTRVRGT